MHFPEILKSKGCGPDRLREIFTSISDDKSKSGPAASTEEVLTTGGTRVLPYYPGTSDVDGNAMTPGDQPKRTNWEIRQKFENQLRSRLYQGILTGINNAKPLQAVDMAWDAPPIQKETVPLLLWAQGKIDHAGICNFLSGTCDPATVAKFVKKRSDGTLGVEIPRISDISINLVRSYVTRRHAALAALWDNLWPLLRYDPRGSDDTAELTADALTQRVDIIADQYNYRHFLSQTDRDKLLYAQSLIFPRSAWDRKLGWRFKKDNLPGRSTEIESYVKREGVDLTNPHPSRWFWDLGAPLANINTENGPSYIAYWDIVRYGVIRDGDYFNVERVACTAGWIQLVAQQYGYFSQYFDPCVLQWPTLGAMSRNPALTNDREANIGLYTSQFSDNGVLLTQYFVKVNPKQEGIGDYDVDIWLRLSAAGDGTIVAAEFMPSLPAAYGGINCNDNRVANASLATEMLPYQDMASNIVSQMIQQLRVSFIMLMLIDEDSLDAEVVKQIKEQGKGLQWWMDPQILVYSASKLRELNISDPRSAFSIVQAEMKNTVEASLRALGSLLGLADRLVNSSPNELGQPNPREVSARETQEISSSLQSVYSFYNEGPREQRTAFKELLFESLICHGQEDFNVPVLKRYKKKTVEAAGFSARGIEQKDDDDYFEEGAAISGKLHQLVYNYYFDSRDGAERPLNTQGANVLQQLFGVMIQIPSVAQKLGPRRIFAMLNIIARMSGAPDEFQIQLDDGESDLMPDQENTLPPVVQKVVQQIMAQMQQLQVQNQQFQQMLAQIAAKIGMPLTPVAAPPTPEGAQGGPPTPSTGAPPVPPSPAGPAPANGAPAPAAGPPGQRILQPA